MLTPERGERRVEEREVLVTLNQKRAARVIHIVAGREVDVLQRAGQIREAPRVDLKAGGAKDSREKQKIFYERHARVRAIARSKSSPIFVPRKDSMSSFALSTTPSVSSTAAASRVSRSSATSAATQSIVSDTPGTL